MLVLVYSRIFEASGWRRGNQVTCQCWRRWLWCWTVNTFTESSRQLRQSNWRLIAEFCSLVHQGCQIWKEFKLLYIIDCDMEFQINLELFHSWNFRNTCGVMDFGISAGYTMKSWNSSPSWNFLVCWLMLCSEQDQVVVFEERLCCSTTIDCL